jgi:hypothetical protein
VRHQQILDKLAARGAVQALDWEVAHRVRQQMYARPAAREELACKVIIPILARWRCLLDGDDALPSRKNVVRVALATVLHKYGFQDADITAQAVTAIDELNRDVVLSDAFERQSDDIKKFLSAPPLPLTRKPSVSRPTTFLRAGDVLSIELGGRFHAAYVWGVSGFNETPRLEFYAGTFTEPPTMSDLMRRRAARPAAHARLHVSGLTYLPDPAQQVKAVAAAYPEGPRGSESAHGPGYTVTDVISLQQHMAALFGPAGTR